MRTHTHAPYRYEHKTNNAKRLQSDRCSDSAAGTGGGCRPTARHRLLHLLKVRLGSPHPQLYHHSGFAKSRRCVSAMMQLFLSWAQFASRHRTRVLWCSKSKRDVHRISADAADAPSFSPPCTEISWF